MSRKSLEAVALVVISTTLTLLLLEAALRTFQWVRTGVDPLTLLPGDRESTFQRSPFLVFGPRVDWAFTKAGDPQWTRFNSMGIRVPWELGPPAPGEVRVLALGGSTTENVWNDLGIHWPLAVECLARQDGRADLRVLNAGMSAYSTGHSLVRYQLDLEALEAQVVLIMHNVNDLTVSYYAAARARPIDRNYLVKYGTDGYTGHVDESDVVVSRIARAARNRLFPDAPSFLPWERWSYDLEEGGAIFRRNLRLLVNAVRQDGGVPVLLTMPRSDDPALVDLARSGDQGSAGLTVIPPAERFFADFDRFNDIVRQVAREERAALVDMAEALARADRSTFVDPVHYSTDGIRAFARALYAQRASWLPDAGARAGLKGRNPVLSCEGVL